MTYAKKTKVPADRTRNEIEALLSKRGASRFAYMTEKGRAIIAFEMQDRKIRFELPVSDGKSDAEVRATRSKWRALLLCVKSKLESIETGIETFEEAFLAHVVMPDGRTVSDHVVPAIADSYTGRNVPLLSAPGRGA